MSKKDNQTKYRVETFGTNVIRRNYEKSKSIVNIPNLLEIQIESYKKFVNDLIQKTFEEIYPIQSKKGDVTIEFIKHHLNKEAFSQREYDEVKYARNKGSNYAAKLFADFKITKENHQTGEVNQSIERDVYICDIPLMTKGGSFIINGSERIIVSQIIRSPNAYFHNQVGSKTFNQHTFLKSGKIIPSRGSWIDYFYKDFKLMKVEPEDIKIKIESQQFYVVELFIAMGISIDRFKELFGSNEESNVTKLVLNSINSWQKHYNNKIKKTQQMSEIEFARKEIYQKLYPAEKLRLNEKPINYFLGMLFDNKRYDLNSVGRHKLNTKLKVSERLYGRFLAEPILDKNEKIIFKSGTKMTSFEIEILNKHIKENNIFLTEIKEIDKEIYRIMDHVNDPTRIYNYRSERNKVHIIKVYLEEDYLALENPTIVSIIGNDSNTNELILTVPDIVATLSYFLNLEDEISSYDDIASLSNRRIRTVGELLENELKVGMLKVEKNINERISAKDKTNITIKSVTNPKPLKVKLKEFFNSSQLSQFMDQINPLSEISNKRRITALGPGGLTRDIAKMSLREVNNSHYGRICPIETPEGLNIGLIINFASHTKVDEYGFLKTPFYVVKNKKVTNEIIYLTIDEETRKYIAHADVRLDNNNMIIEKEVIVRHKEDINKSELVIVPAEKINLCDVSPIQVFSVATSLIPFLENTDANRALMGANMQRQALPLIWSEEPIVATGMEQEVAKFSPSNLKSDVDGEVVYFDSMRIDIKDSKTKKVVSHFLRKFERSNNGTSINQQPTIKLKQNVKKGELISDGPSVSNGELALGKNVLVAFTTWDGYNYEDAIVISERLVKDDVYTSIHIEEYELICRKTKIGDEEITTEVPNISKYARRNLDENGIIQIGAEVKPGDILVGKVTPKGEDDLLPEERLLNVVLGNKAKDKRDTSLKLPHGGEGIVHMIKILDRKQGDTLEDDVEKIIKVFIVQKRKIKEGDKMAGRHGNKGVISKVLPIEDMPYLEDGTPVDIMLNPLGVPSRMNIGQILELHLGLAAKKLNIKVVTPIFNGIDNQSLEEIMEEASIPKNGKLKLFDGRTGEEFDNPIAVGYIYMLKLSHMVDDKIHARSVGAYSLITQQPLGGKSQNGGQRFGEMEAWALEGYGASNLLQEMFTLKSDDIRGRNELYNSIIRGKNLPKPSFPESLWVLFYEIRGLGLSMEFLNKKGEPFQDKYLNDLG